MKFKGFKFGKQKDEEEAYLEETEDYEPEPEYEDVDPEEAPPAPHGPLLELTVDAPPAIDDSDEVIDFGGIDMPVTPDTDDEEITVVEVNASDLAKPGIPADTVGNTDEAADAQPEVSLDDSLSSLFSMEEEEANPLATLINSLPDVTVQELMDDIQEIKEIMQEWQHH